MKDLISIIIPTYQHAASLGACLDSILAQTYKMIEIIVVNDGSTDGTLEILKPYTNKIRLINQENQGSNPARNRGWQEAKGDYLIFCDADVRMKPEMLQTMLNALKDNPQASYVYSAFKFGWKKFRGVTFNPDRLRERNFIHTTSLIRAIDFPGFDNHIKRLQDWDVWLTMLSQNKIGVLLPEVLFEVAIVGNSRVGSSWMPSMMYYIPWKIIRWQPKRIRNYQQAREVIAKKHYLTD